MRLTLFFTINILSHKGLHNCVKEVKNLEQLKEREETEMRSTKRRHFLVLRRGREFGRSDSCESPAKTRGNDISVLRGCGTGLRERKVSILRDFTWIDLRDALLNHLLQHRSKWFKKE